MALELPLREDLAERGGVREPAEFAVSQSTGSVATAHLLSEAGGVVYEVQRAIAVGMGGAALDIQGGEPCPVGPGTPPDLSCVAIDTLGRHWAAGPGKVWSRRTTGPWTCVWEHAAWQPPFVSIMAEIGTVVAMTVDGAVLECRSVLLDKTLTAL